MNSDRDYSLFESELTGAALNLSMLGRLLKWLSPYKRQLLVSIVLVLLASTLQIMLPIMISIVAIDHILNEADDSNTPDFGLIELNNFCSTFFNMPPLLTACCLFFFIQVLWAITGHAHRMTLADAVVKGLRDLRKDIFLHLETRPASFYDRVSVGRVMTRITNDVEALFELLRGLGSLIGEFVPFFVAVWIMLAIDAQLTLILLLALPILGIATYYFRSVTRRLFREVRHTLSSLNQNLQENLAGMQVVQISDRQSLNLETYSNINKKNRDAEIRSVKIETLYGAFNDSLVHAAIGAVIWYGASHVSDLRLSIGEVVLFTQFVGMLFHPVVVLGEQTNVLFRAMASGERIFQALDWDEQIHEPQQPTALPPRLQGKVQFKNLSFGYEPSNLVLKNISLTIAPGEKLAIVGPTGSGKSTLIRLLSRFYDFQQGAIFIDDLDLNDIHSREIRRRVGVVLQDFHVFSGTIYENIALGNKAIDTAAAESAAKLVNAHEFISKLPQKYNTVVSERGQNLSQGQRQLLAFARVLAANPEILILDEATANIDTETELHIQNALRTLTANRTAITIAHRLQTVQDADRVLVLHHGELAELGTHESLLASGGLYAKFYSLQFAI